ncbi:hypothetical protein ACFWPV_26765 [Streptomyces uncialis]
MGGSSATPPGLGGKRMDALSARWGVETRPLGKAVWAEVRR